MLHVELDLPMIVAVSELQHRLSFGSRNGQALAKSEIPFPRVIGPGAKLPSTKTGVTTSEGSSHSVSGLSPGLKLLWFWHTCHRLQVASYARARYVTDCKKTKAESSVFAIKTDYLHDHYSLIRHGTWRREISSFFDLHWSLD